VESISTRKNLPVLGTERYEHSIQHVCSQPNKTMPDRCVTVRTRKECKKYKWREQYSPSVCNPPAFIKIIDRTGETGMRSELQRCAEDDTAIDVVEAIDTREFFQIVF
jgi:hypothetical protein